MTKARLLDIFTRHDDDDDACEVQIMLERASGEIEEAYIDSARYQRTEDGYEATEIFLIARLYDEGVDT